MRLRRRCALPAMALVVAAAAPSLLRAEAGPPAAPTGDARTGAFTLSFTERSPLGLKAAVDQRLKHDADAAQNAYDPKGETYDVYVPEDYDPAKRYGLLVWINGDEHGKLFKSWHKVFAKRRMIAIGANKSGNAHHMFGRRIPLALDAAYNMKKRYTIDPSRTYISGFSGGGRMASIIAVNYPDLFEGGFYVCGCEPPEKWGMASREPGSSQIKARNRYVFLTGEGDGNENNTKRVLDDYKASGFLHTSFFWVPKLKHNPPSDGLWVEKVLDALDAPLLETAKKRFEKAKAAERSSPAQALETYLDLAELETSPGPEARERLAELRKPIDELVAETEKAIQDKFWPKANANISTLRRRYGKAAEKDAASLDLAVRNARAAK